MNRMNGWEVYLKIKELMNGSGQDHLHIDDVVRDFGITEELAREYLTALDVLKFIRFSDATKNVFVLVDISGG